MQIKGKFLWALDRMKKHQDVDPILATLKWSNAAESTKEYLNAYLIERWDDLRRRLAYDTPDPNKLLALQGEAKALLDLERDLEFVIHAGEETATKK